MNKILTLTGVSLLLALSAQAEAGTINLDPANPLMVAGNPYDPVNPDSPENRIDPNIPSSPYAGVVSLYTQKDDGEMLCTGTAISKRHILTAAHCLDGSGNGTTAGVNRVRAVFNHDGDYSANPARNLIDANIGNIAIHPDYQGYGNCPTGVSVDQCVNDDVAIVTLDQDIPAGVPTYGISFAPLATGTKLNMVGYGTSGDGYYGFYVDPELHIKRSGQNIADKMDGDDENSFGGVPEVWYADFDGYDPDTGENIDYHCTEKQICSEVLPNGVEAGLGDGDSGGPSFILTATGEYLLVANNTFGGQGMAWAGGAFGSYFGGMILSAYRDWIIQVTGGAIRAVPEPTSTVLLGLGLLGLAGLRRRKA